jgi:hypothetical protein
MVPIASPETSVALLSACWARVPTAASMSARALSVWGRNSFLRSASKSLAGSAAGAAWGCCSAFSGAIALPLLLLG